MDAEQVVEKILSQARAQADEIVAEAGAKARAESEKLADELEHYRSETARLAVEAGEEQKARMLANARMENRKETLAAKVALLDEVFRAAAARIRSLEDDQYLQLMKSLITKVVETGDESVIVGHNETRINDRFIRDLNRQLGTGYRGSLRLADERADIDGGCILKRNNIQVNISTNVLIEQVRQKVEIDLAAALLE